MTVLSPVSPSTFAALKQRLVAGGSVIKVLTSGDNEGGIVIAQKKVLFATIHIEVSYFYIPAKQELQVNVEKGPEDRVIAGLREQVGMG